VRLEAMPTITSQRHEWRRIVRFPQRGCVRSGAQVILEQHLVCMAPTAALFLALGRRRLNASRFANSGAQAGC